LTVFAIKTNLDDMFVHRSRLVQVVLLMLYTVGELRGRPVTLGLDSGWPLFAHV